MPNAWSNAYREAAVWTIRDRFDEQRKENVQAYVGGSALVVQKDKELKDALARIHPDLKADENEYAFADYDLLGMEAGQKAGREVDLTPKERLPGGHDAGPALPA